MSEGSVLGGGGAVRGDELLLELRRRGLVVAELEAVRAVARGERLEACRKVLELRERRLRRDLHGAGTRRVRALDLPAVPGQLAGDVAHLGLRRDDVDIDDRLTPPRPRPAQRLEQGP